MKKLVFLAMLMVMCVGVQAQAKVINQSSKESNFKTYEIREGETLSEIAWVLGISMKRLTEWNPEVLETGIRNLQPGTVLKYKTDKDLEEEVMGSQEKIREKIQKLKEAQIRVVKESSKAREEAKEQGGRTRKEVKEQGQDTRQTVSSEAQRTRSQVSQEGESTRDVVDKKGDSILEKIETTQEELTRDLQDSGKQFWVLLVVLVGIVCLLLSIIWLLWKQEQQEQGEKENKGVSEGAEADNFDQQKLEELGQITLQPESGEEEVEFQLKGHKFNILLAYDDTRGYRSWQLQPNATEYKWFGQRNDAVKSIKSSLKNYLMDKESEENKIKEAARNGKIKKI
jgi:murein DD-endopeptidase MepM/ murein hydrolase activator NlpD